MFTSLVHSPRWRRAALWALISIVSPAAFAELSNTPMAGVGVRARPAYDGSDTQRAEIVPVIRYLGTPWLLRSTQGVLEGGLRMEVAPGLYLGAQVAYEAGRQASESSFLKSRGIEDVDRGASLGAHLEWDHKFGPVPITVLARSRHHTDSEKGVQADLRLSVGVYQSKDRRLGVGLFTQATWASTKSTALYYGVTPQQSAVSGLATYSPGSGIQLGSLGVLYSYEVTPKWSIVGNAGVQHLYGDARRSPLVERSTNIFGAIGAAYTF